MAQVKDLTVEELQEIISRTVEETLEDTLALSSASYLNSIKEAREEYRQGQVASFEDIFDA